MADVIGSAPAPDWMCVKRTTKCNVFTDIEASIRPGCDWRHLSSPVLISTMDEEDGSKRISLSCGWMTLDAIPWLISELQAIAASETAEVGKP